MKKSYWLLLFAFILSFAFAFYFGYGYMYKKRDYEELLEKNKSLDKSSA
jgi:hypothetical protein